MAKVEFYGLRSFIGEAGIVKVFGHIERHQGQTMIFIDSIRIGGSIEYLELTVRIKEIAREVKKKIKSG
ncbi:MAG: hypothetical protein DRP01_06995 [Archaeoglobales archaeon]|nr:MAG: hypothetical protein DRP01_06995 [Archaeoglobales archaeon]